MSSTYENSRIKEILDSAIGDVDNKLAPEQKSRALIVIAAAAVGSLKLETLCLCPELLTDKKWLSGFNTLETVLATVVTKTPEELQYYLATKKALDKDFMDIMNKFQK